MPVARHPPHRSLHEELPHRAPTSGNNAQALLCRDWPPHQTAFRIWSAHFTSQRPNVGDTLGCVRSFPLRARLGFTMSIPSPALCPELVSLNRFPLVSPLSSTSSADHSAPQPLFEGFTGTIGLSTSRNRSSPSYSLDSRRGPRGATRQGQFAGSPGSRA
jgi:hypothetical protein